MAISEKAGRRQRCTDFEKGDWVQIRPLDGYDLSGHFGIVGGVNEVKEVVSVKVFSAGENLDFIPDMIEKTGNKGQTYVSGIAVSC